MSHSLERLCVDRISATKKKCHRASSGNRHSRLQSPRNVGVGASINLNLLARAMLWTFSWSDLAKKTTNWIGSKIVGTFCDCIKANTIKACRLFLSYHCNCDDHHHHYLTNFTLEVQCSSIVSTQSIHVNVDSPESIRGGGGIRSFIIKGHISPWLTEWLVSPLLAWLV